MEAPLLLGSIAVVTSVMAFVWAVSGRRPPPTLELVGRPTRTDLHMATLDQGLGVRTVQPAFARLAHLARRYTPRGRLAALEQRLLVAGTPPQWTLERVLVVKTLLALTAAALGLLRMLVDPSALALVLTILLTVGGFFLPDMLLARKAEQRQTVIRKALADTFDQLAITVRAGLGLDAAIARVANTSEGPLALELARVVQDTRAGMSRADALTALSERVRLPELRQVVVALVQAEKLGVPVSQTLQVQAAELRVKRRQHAEEQAMKLPVKIIFPMVFCVLPCLFIVVLGPAAMNIYDSLVKG
jgi:tight adherence protein C